VLTSIGSAVPTRVMDAKRAADFWRVSESEFKRMATRLPRHAVTERRFCTFEASSWHGSWDGNDPARSCTGALTRLEHGGFKEVEQSLREAAGERRSFHLRGDESLDGKEIGSLMRGFRQFQGDVRKVLILRPSEHLPTGKPLNPIK
jgi:hypothetical protein